MNKNIFFLTILIFSFFFVSAQKERKFIREGNDSYNSNSFKNSEVSYRKAIDKNKESFDAAFNIGDALYKQKKYDEANKQFSSILNDELSNNSKSKLFHNIGNSFLQSKKYKESIEAYKNALRANPNDMDTKYNLAYAKNMLKQQQQKKKNNKNQDKKNKDKQKDKKQDKNKKNQDKQKDKKKQDNKEQDKKNNDQKKQQQQAKPKISKKDAEKLLKSLQADEKKVQDKLKKQKAKTVRVKSEKEW